VPLLVRAPGRVPAGVVLEQPVHFTAFVRTAASLLGVPPPTTAGAGENLAAPAH
jgi:arylsulfatase A-like enzyme